MKNKKGAVVSGLTTILLYFGFILLIIIFFFIFKTTGGPQEVAITGHIADTDTNYALFSYLKTPVKVEGREMTIADILSMVDLEDGKEQRIKIFQEATKNTFEQLYPSDKQIPYRWWIKVYAEDEEPKIGLGSGKYMGGFAAPGKGFQYVTSPGASCNPQGSRYNDVVSSVIVPKINGGYVKLVFCMYK